MLYCFCSFCILYYMKNLFQRHEIQFIAWFCGFFLISVMVLAMLGLLPSEFTPDGGRTFEQVTRDAVREIIEGHPVDSSQPNNGIIASNAGNNGNGDNNANNAGDANGSANGQNNSGANPNMNNANMGTGMTPNASSGNGMTVDTNSQIQTNTGATMYAEEPTRLVIASIGVDTKVSNPKSTSAEVLDTALTKSAVRYPGSGLPGVGNMFIFGHSTGFSVVQNQAYKVFNKIKTAKVGATVNVYSKSATYEYKVTSVKLVDKSKALVEFDTAKNMLTLSTCDSFGRDQDRYVLEADLVSVTKTM